MAAVSLVHRESDSGHLRTVPSAHGETEVERLVVDGTLDVAKAAAPGGYSRGGFAGTYAAPERTIGLLAGGWPPRKGPRAGLEPLRAGLGAVLEMADADTLTLRELSSSLELCPCQAAEMPDGEWLRSVLIERADPGFEDDRNRQITALMLLEAVGTGTEPAIERAFRLVHGFGAPIDGTSEAASARRAWRAAILRNYSVSAWRHLWRWLSEQLVGDALTVQELGDRLADALGAQSVGAFLSELPDRFESNELLPAEESIRDSDEPVPVSALRQLAIGAARLDDLDEETRTAFIGRDQNDLGPLWLQHQLAEHRTSSLAALGRDLAATLVRRAKRVANSKMYLTSDLRPYVPTRLRDRDGRLYTIGVESDAEVSLRSWTLAQILVALGAIERPEGGYTITSKGEALRDHLAAENEVSAA